MKHSHQGQESRSFVQDDELRSFELRFAKLVWLRCPKVWAVVLHENRRDPFAVLRMTTI
jgi:hypothetical protein